MKLTTALATLAMSATLWAAPAAPVINVAFDTHDGYFVSNKFEPKETTSFVVLQDQKAFDNVFGAGFVMRDKAHRLPKDAFAKLNVIAAIHRGKAFVEYKVDSVTREGATLRVKYTTKSRPPGTAEYACPLILSVPKGDYSEVQFNEDGKDVKKVAATALNTVSICRLLHRPPDAQKRGPRPFSATSREAGTLSLAADGEKTVVTIKGGRGIGSGKVTRGAAPWPKELILRAYLGGLEKLQFSDGTAQLSAEFQSHGDFATLLELTINGKAAPAPDKNSRYYLEIRACDAAGNAVRGLPPRGGYFETKIPAALLGDNTELTLSWIDFYR